MAEVKTLKGDWKTVGANTVYETRAWRIPFKARSGKFNRGKPLIQIDHPRTDTPPIYVPVVTEDLLAVHAAVLLHIDTYCTYICNVSPP